MLSNSFCEGLVITIAATTFSKGIAGASSGNDISFWHEARKKINRIKKKYFLLIIRRKTSTKVNRIYNGKGVLNRKN
jgi:hypothetical protein